MPQPLETITITVTATKPVMERFKRLIARLQRNCHIGHSAKVGMFIDGDGWDKFKVEGIDLMAYMANGRPDAAAGYDFEMAGENGYYLVREERPRRD